VGESRRPETAHADEDPPAIRVARGTRPEDVRSPKLAKRTELEGLPSWHSYTAETRGLTLTPALITTIAEAYYRHRGSLSRAGQELGIPYQRLLGWRKDTPALAGLLRLGDALIAEQVHEQFMGKVLDATERNAVYKIFYLKNHDPRYAEKPKQILKKIEISDTTFKKPKAIPATVT